MQMLENLSNNLALSRTVFFPHRSVYEFDDVPIKVSDKMLQVFAVCLRIQTFPADPLHGVTDVQKINCHIFVL